jgi:hypothetical protein
MSKLFLIIYAGAQIGGAAGPLPYGMDECERRRDEFRAAQTEVLATGFSKAEGRKVTQDEIEDLKQVRFECEYREARPVVARSQEA